MPNHPAIAPGRVAVITGGAGGIGLAAAKRLASLGLRIVIADVDQAGLDAAAAEIAAAAPGKDEAVVAVRCDVSRMDEVQRPQGAGLCRIRRGGGAHEQCRHGSGRRSVRPLRPLAARASASICGA